MIWRPIIAVLALMSYPAFAAEVARVAGKNIRIEFDGAMHSRVVATIEGHERVVGDFAPSESIRISGHEVTDFTLQKQNREPTRDRLGAGFRTMMTGTASPLKRTVIVTVDQFPGWHS
jgi:hypothetical protein